MIKYRERVMWWRLILEEISPKQFCIKGSKYIVADVLSRLDKIDNINNSNSNSNNKVVPTLESLSEHFAFNKEDVLHPTSVKTIMRFQQKDTSLIEITKEKPNHYSIKCFHGAGTIYSLICRHKKIMILKEIQKTLVEWYHNMLCHTGETMTELTFGQHFY